MRHPIRHTSVEEGLILYIYILLTLVRSNEQSTLEILLEISRSKVYILPRWRLDNQLTHSTVPPGTENIGG